MNDKTKLFFVTVIVTLFMTATMILHETKNIQTFDVKMYTFIEEPIVSLNSDGNLSLPYYKLNDTSVHDILMKHNFSNWSYVEQLQLTNMMSMTAKRITFDESYMNEVAMLNNSTSIFNAYIDLLENAVY